MENLMFSVENTAKPIIEAPVTMTTTWQDVGPRINTKGLLNIALWLKGNKNLSDSVRFRCKCYIDDKSTEAFYAQVQTIGSNLVSLRPEEYETSESIINLATPLGFSSMVPFIQIEMKVNVVGATAAVIDSAYISFDRK